MDNKRISIRFCGACNPRINLTQTAQKLKDSFTHEGAKVVYNGLDADLMVYLSGCPASCARRYCDSLLPCVIVAGESVDAVFIKSEDISPQVFNKVRSYFS